MIGTSDVAGYEDIRIWLNERCGIVFPDKKKDLLRHRLGRILTRFGFDDLNELAHHLMRGEALDLQLAVMHAASTHHTFFFREPQVLDFFRNRILPSLAERETIRIWSAAASTGDEAYTLAILAAEFFGRSQIAKRVAILGTDISEPVVKQAEAAVYNATHLEQVPKDVIRQYFSRVEVDQYKIADDIREVCTFRRMNIKSSPYPFSRMFPVIFCRNVLYYFDREHQVAILESLYDVTEPGGWLLTSVTEAVRDLGTRWQVVSSGVYRKPACP